MTGSKSYQKRHIKTRQHRRRTAAERLQRDRAQAQQAAKVLEQALGDLGLPEDLVTEIEGRLRSQHKLDFGHVGHEPPLTTALGDDWPGGFLGR